MQSPNPNIISSVFRSAAPAAAQSCFQLGSAKNKAAHIRSRAVSQPRISPRRFSIRPFEVRNCPVLLLIILSGLVNVCRVQAQTNFGTLVGTVTDPTGAAVAGAAVTAKNTGTNITTRTVTTGNSGDYDFANLLPGIYSLTIVRTGFKGFTADNIDVRIGGTTRVNAGLAVGSVVQSVKVDASQNDLQTDSSTLSGVIEGEQVLDSPLNGRNVENLMDFIPGVVPGGGTGFSTVSNGGSGSFQVGTQTQNIAYGNYQIGGAFSGLSSFYVDGVPSNISYNNINALVPTQDAVQEFRVSTNNVSAEFGGFAGGVVEISTKSGTSAFHGAFYEYLRNTDLDSYDWFSKHNGLPIAPLHLNQFGARIGGPILKNKAFFFFSWERLSLSSGSFVTDTVPTAQELSGNFSAIAQPIYDLSAPGSPQFSCNGVLNVICPGRIDSTSAAILALESPATNRPGIVNNFVATAPIEGLQDQYNARVDYHISPADSLFIRYTFWNPHNGISDPFQNKTGAGPTGNTTQEAVIGDTHDFNSSTVADLRIAYLFNENFQFPLSQGYDMANLGPAYGEIQAQSYQQEGLIPGLGIQGYAIGAEGSQLRFNNGIYSINGSLMKTIGRHTFKFGGAGRQLLWIAYGNGQGVDLSALPSFTASPTNPTGSGNALASFLLGIPSSASSTQLPTTHTFYHPFGFYATDTFQATNKLTLNLGLRWDQPGSYTEVNGLDTVLQPDAPNSLGTIFNPVTGVSQALTGRLALVDSPQYPSRREETLHWDLFSPRVGFAYRATDKTVIRSGYGIAYLPTEYTSDGPGNFGSSIDDSTTSLSNIPGQTPLTTVDNPLPNGVIEPPGRNPAGLIALLGQSILSREPNTRYSYVQQWNLSIERAIDSKSTLTLEYAGSKGTHLIIFNSTTNSAYNLNQLPDQYHSLGNTLLNQVTNPFYGEIVNGPLAGPTIAEGYLLQPHPQYQSMNQGVPRFGDSAYNALYSTFVRRYNNGQIIQVAYTWSKLLGDTDNTSAFQDGQAGLATVQDFTNLKAEKSLSEQDHRQNLVINYGIDIPVGRGRAYLQNMNKPADAVLGGWRVNGITTFRSGNAVPLVAGSNSLNATFGSGTIRPNYSAGCQRVIKGAAQSKVMEWFNTSCFTQPGSFSFGNEPRVDPAIKTAGVANYDFSASKTVNLKRETNLQFVAQFFNIFNRVQFAEPDSGLSDAAFGQVLGQANNPRQIQFALRYTF
jgi:hypothetical protein